MDSIEERCAKKLRANGSPIKSALKSPSKTPTVMTHVIHSPPERADRAVPDSPSGDAGPGAADEFRTFVMTKLQERETAEQLLIARVAVAETKIHNLEGKAARLEPLEAHVHDAGVLQKIFGGINKFVTDEHLMAKLDEVRKEVFKPQRDIEQDIELVKHDLKDHFALLNKLDEEFKGHVKGAFGIVENGCEKLVKEFERITSGIAADGSFNHAQLQHNFGLLQDTVSHLAAANMQKDQALQIQITGALNECMSIKADVQQVNEQFIRLASSSPSTSTWPPGVAGGSQGPCHG